MNFDEMHEKYLKDPEFYHLVNIMYSFLYKQEVNVSTLKSAATFAAYKFESEHVRKVYQVKD